MISKNLEYTALVNGLSLLKIPLLAFCTPKVVELTDSRAVVRTRLDWRTKNHVGVMYFGALAMGAELSIALKAIEQIRNSRKKIEFIFKDFSCEFLKRADHHVHFICEESNAVAELITKACSHHERLNQTFRGFAIVPKHGDEPIMKYSLTLSVRNRSR